MLKYADYDIVFQEIPNEVTLAINISNCPNRCVGCHSPYLMEDVGEELNETSLDALIEKYGKDVTCVCFMGGDADHKSVVTLAHYIKEKYQPLKVGWYSGKPNLPESFPLGLHYCPPNIEYTDKCKKGYNFNFHVSNLQNCLNKWRL